MLKCEYASTVLWYPASVTLSLDGGGGIFASTGWSSCIGLKSSLVSIVSMSRDSSGHGWIVPAFDVYICIYMDVVTVKSWDSYVTMSGASQISEYGR